MPEQMQVKMNGVIPSVPITTLAGITSLTDLLPEMPLPSPLPQTLEKKSLLFHPRVAEEAKILLSVRDENLVPQLINSLAKTSAEHIELKEQYAGPEVGSEQAMPELLQAILQINPMAFKGPQYNSPQRSWPHQATAHQSPAYGRFSPSYSSSSGSRQTPQGSPAHPAPARMLDPAQMPHPRLPVAPHNHADIAQMSPFAVPSPSPRATVITEQSRTTPHHQMQDDANCIASLGMLHPQQPSIYSPAHMNSPHQQHLQIPQQVYDPMLSQHLQQPLDQMQMPGVHDAHFSNVLDNVPLPDIDIPIENLVSGKPVGLEIPDVQMLGHQQPFPDLQPNPVPPPVYPDNNIDKLKVIPHKEPVVLLNRLSAEDQALMQKSLASFAEKAPGRAAKMGIKINDKSESESDSEVEKDNKHFKARAKERQAQKEKDKAERKKSDGRKRKRLDSDDSADEKKEFIQKPKIRKFEKKLVPVLAKLSVEELMETNTYQRFNSSIETIFENTDDFATMEIDDDGDVPGELLIPKYELQELCTEAAKLKALGATESIPQDRLVKLLMILEKNIRDGARVSPLADPDDDVEESKMWMQLAMERVQRAVDASLIALNIMTSSNMPKTVYLEDVIDRIVLFMKFQLQNTIYPSFDPVYKVSSKNKKNDNFNASAKKKRGHIKEVREKSILQLYNKMQELVGLLAELLNIQILTDTIVLHASTLGVAPFFVESISDLQLRALKLVTVIFTKYEKHRKLLLDDILASIARLPSSKKSLRTYRLNNNSEENIQMLTALVLQLIQCVVVLSDGMLQDKKEEEKKVPAVDADVLVMNRYETARGTAHNFLTVFLGKCSSKGEEVDYRPLFENFVQDLLMTVNKPEWPAAEMLLSLLGRLLVNHFSNKGSDMSLRVASIEYLGVVAARLRKDTVNSTCKLSTIDQIIRDIKAEQKKDGDLDKEIPGLSEDEERTIFLQKVLLDYLAVNGTKESALGYARHFYLAQWYRDLVIEKRNVGTPKKSSPKKHKKRVKKKNRLHSDSESESSVEEIDPDENDNEQKNSEVYRIIEEKKKLLISKIRPYSTGTKTDTLQTYIDYNSAELIAQYLASKQPFSQSFNLYLKQLITVLKESSIAIRTKAMKCLTMIVDADPSVLGIYDMQVGVKYSFHDHSTSVREAAVDLIGKFVLSRPELIDKYYDMLLARILDTGVSVRKRVIKILKDICIECPEYPKVPEICGRMIRRVNDEEGIRKLVMEVFQNMWFTPVKGGDQAALLRKVMNITDVVDSNKEMGGHEWFEQLLVSLFKPKEDKEDSTKINYEPPKTLLTACKQIIDCLIQNVIKLEETRPDLDPTPGKRRGSSHRLVACVITLHLFAKIRPQLLIDHAITLQPYLALKCQTQGDYQIVSSVAHTLELVVPLMEHPSETFLAQLEEDSVKLIIGADKSVVESCLSCLGSIVNNVTKNYRLMRDAFQRYFSFLKDYKKMTDLDPTSPKLAQNRPFLYRSLFTVGLFLRHFDFTRPEVIEGMPENIKNEVFELLLYYVHLDNKDIRFFTLGAIGFMCIRHYEFMMLPEVKELYNYLLTSDLAPEKTRTQVLTNIEKYLQEEDKRMIKQDQEWAKLAKGENLKEMNDVSSGMASTVIQIYLKEILESFMHKEVTVRMAALKVIQLILSQGLVNPIDIIPYLICMSTDCEVAVCNSADKQLQEIEKKYPGFVNARVIYGIRLSYRLQQLLQPEHPVRGMRTREGDAFPGALNGFLYSILRTTRMQRRAILQIFLKQFDESARTSLAQMLYLADNLAYFPYQALDEPLFIIHTIDINLSVNGTNLVQSFKEALIPKESSVQQLQPQVQMVIGPDGQPRPQFVHPQPVEEEDDDEEDEEAILARVPADTTTLRELITASQGFLLLLTLRQHLKDLYGLTDAKIQQYSPSDAAKLYEKNLSRKSNTLFKPKATLQRLKGVDETMELDEEGRRKLVKEYLEFKQLMLRFDPEDEDAKESGEANTTSTTVCRIVPESPDKGDHLNNSQPRIPKITIQTTHHPAPEIKEHRSKHRVHKTEKPKKHKKKKRRRISDSSESGDDYSDPDFQM